MRWLSGVIFEGGVSEDCRLVRFGATRWPGSTESMTLSLPVLYDGRVIGRVEHVWRDHRKIMVIGDADLNDVGETLYPTAAGDGCMDTLVGGVLAFDSYELRGIVFSTARPPWPILQRTFEAWEL